MGKATYRGSAPPDHPVFHDGVQVFLRTNKKYKRAVGLQLPTLDEWDDARYIGIMVFSPLGKIYKKYTISRELAKKLEGDNEHMA